ncbi:YraN family protein [Aeromicrobium sp.]|nr:YraN family protein [Candidatus Saccharibacteria bacterium]
MTTFTIGRQAEKVAAEYLRAKGYEILEQNYRTRFCEIDIIARKNKFLYFTEVKYRRSDAQGGGLEYITSKKLKQMAFAANTWLQERPAPRGYYLAAIEVGGSAFTVRNFIESLTI